MVVFSQYRCRLPLLVAVTAGLTVACDAHDLGQPCPQLLSTADVPVTNPDDASTTRRETPEVVGQDTIFPCDELVCIATDGSSGYCSKKCRSDSACPEGFACRVIMDIGPFAGESFCAWKRCTSRADCGHKKDFCCAGAADDGAVDELQVKVCSFSRGGKC